MYSKPVDKRPIKKKSFEEYKDCLTTADYLKFLSTLDDEDQGNMVKAIAECNQPLLDDYFNQIDNYLFEKYENIDSTDYPDMFYNMEDER